VPSRARATAHELPPRPAGLETEEAATVAGALGAIAAAEFIVVFVSVPVGAAFHALLVFGLVIQWIVREPTALRRCLAALSLAPLLRIVSMALVLPDLESIDWGTFAAALILLSALLMARALGMNQTELRLWVPVQPRPLLVLSGAAFLVALPASPWLDRFPATGGAAAFLVLAAVAEEVTFRGVIQGTLRTLFGRSAILYSTVPFVVVYFATRSLSMVLLAAVLGIVAGWAVERFRSVWMAIGIHAAFSLGAGILWPGLLGI
jgi:membrane protease YdiL (CAAX protease family)